MSGFIAHYDLNGFQWHYKDLRNLIADLENSNDILRPDYYSQDFFINDYGQEYCNSKVTTLKGIPELIKTYKNSVLLHFETVERQKDIQTIKTLLQKHNLKEVST